MATPGKARPVSASSALWRGSARPRPISTRTTRPKSAGQLRSTSRQKSGTDEDNLDVTVKEKLKLARLKIESLERELANRTHQTLQARASEASWKHKIEEIVRNVEQERQDRIGVAVDMTRQYKMMQTELINRINDLEDQVAILTDKLELAHITLAETVRAKDEIIAEKDRTISDLRRRMEHLAVEFSDMLRETIEKLHEQIDLSGYVKNEGAGLKHLAAAAQASIRAAIPSLVGAAESEYDESEEAPNAAVMVTPEHLQKNLGAEEFSLPAATM